jgi:hypothetical protein
MPAFSTSSPSRTTTDKRTPWGNEVDVVGVAAWFMAKFLWLKFSGVLGHWLMLDESDGSHGRVRAFLIKDRQPARRR